MKEMVRYGVILSLICVIASASLAAVNSVTESKIIAQAESEEKAGLKEVLPEGEKFEAVKLGDEIIYYKAYDKNNRIIGAAFKASGKGYSSAVETIAGMTKDGIITAIKVINQNETPGLGAKVAESPFSAQFAQKAFQKLDEVQAITGATISSTAVIDSVKKKAAEIKGLIENNPFNSAWGHAERVEGELKHER